MPHIYGGGCRRQDIVGLCSIYTLAHLRGSFGRHLSWPCLPNGKKSGWSLSQAVCTLMSWRWTGTPGRGCLSNGSSSSGYPQMMPPSFVRSTRPSRPCRARPTRTSGRLMPCTAQRSGFESGSWRRPSYSNSDYRLDPSVGMSKASMLSRVTADRRRNDADWVTSLRWVNTRDLGCVWVLRFEVSLSFGGSRSGRLGGRKTPALPA